MAIVSRGFRGRRREQAEGLPPGQYVTEKWPVLHYGSVPRFNKDTWDFKVWGLVENELRFTYDEFLALPHRSFKADVHCVTRWSLFDSDWEGVSVQEVLKLARPEPEARFVMAHCENNFSANLPIEDIDREAALFAYRRNGENITPEHGWPLRLFVPHLYFWKSAKWVRGLQLTTYDSPGFWESLGYHNHGDPWREQRYWGD